LLKQKFDVTVSDSTVGLHLKRLGFTPQKPEYQDIERDEQEIDYFLKIKIPKIQRLAERIGAYIGFSGRIRRRCDDTAWQDVGKTRRNTCRSNEHEKGRV